jgi:predicted nucleotidyltransferase
MDWRQMRKPKDRDFIQTVEGMLFCVTGYLHPPDKYTAYLKYSPAPVGRWKDGEVFYRREMNYYHVRNVAAVIASLEQHYPHYVHYCPVRDIRFSMIPRQYVKKYYCPENRLAEILAHPRDSLEEKVCDMVDEIVTHARIGAEDLGITGSVLLGIHDPRFSDIDLTIHGLENTLRLKAMIQESRSEHFGPVGDEQRRTWSRHVAERFPLTYDQARYLADRRWRYGYFGQRYFSLHPTRRHEEIRERYGDHVYRDRGVVRISATVVDASESMFLPATYRVEDVTIMEREIEGIAGEIEIEEIVSYEGLYCEVADAGDEVEAHGKLEQVDDGRSYRLVVGTTRLQSGGWIKPSVGREG